MNTSATLTLLVLCSAFSVITTEAGAGGKMERLSWDAWGKRRHPDGKEDPAGSITSETNRGFTGHEQLDSVGLIHMNGRVYDPLLGRFGSPDPMTENPFSTQGWNRYSYVGNSPVNFTDPSGYCFMGCFWQPVFKAIGTFFRQSWGDPSADHRHGGLQSGNGMNTQSGVCRARLLRGRSDQRQHWSSRPRCCHRLCHSRSFRCCRHCDVGTRAQNARRSVTFDAQERVRVMPRGWRREDEILLGYAPLVATPPDGTRH